MFAHKIADFTGPDDLQWVETEEPAADGGVLIDVAPQLKRFAARAKGRGTRIVKRNSHITVAVSDGKKD